MQMVCRHYKACHRLVALGSILRGAKFAPSCMLHSNASFYPWLLQAACQKQSSQMEVRALVQTMVSECEQTVGRYSQLWSTTLFLSATTLDNIPAAHALTAIWGASADHLSVVCSACCPTPIDES